MRNRPQPKQGRTRCGLLRRMAAVIYDAFIVTGLLLIATAVISPLDDGNQQAFRDPFFTLYLFTIWYFYIAMCWMNGGMTVGMRAWKIILLADEGKTTWKLCLVRFLSALFSAALFGIGFIWSLFDHQQRSWHDMSSHSGLYRV